jgi:hypothetical protein
MDDLRIQITTIIEVLDEHMSEGIENQNNRQAKKRT